MLSPVPKSIPKSATKYLSAALGDLDHDRYERFADENTRPNLNGVIAALYMAEGEVDELMKKFTPKTKQAFELAKREAAFKQYIFEMYSLVKKETVPFSPIRIENFYPDFVKNENIVEHTPWLDKNNEGSLVNCQEWALYNQQRMAQHKFTLLLCREVLSGSSTTKYALSDISTAHLWCRQKQVHFRNTYMKLVLLEGDITKIQMLREQLMEATVGPNQMISHFYSRLEQDSGGRTSNDDRLRQEIISSVQTPVAGYNPSMNDLGL